VSRRARAAALLALLALAVPCPPTARAADQPAYLWPAPGNRVIVQSYRKYGHEAIDIAGAIGDPVVASRQGEILYALTGCVNVDGASTGVRCSRAGCSEASRLNHPHQGYCNYGLGNGVIIRHQDGSFAIYGHLDAVEPGLERGATVQAGQRLGEVGSSGRAIGAELHFALTARNSGGFTRKRADPAKVFGPYIAVFTTEATDITAASARLQGQVSYLGDAPERVGILLGLSAEALRPQPAYADDQLPDLPNMVLRYDVAQIDGASLQPDTTYYWRCYAERQGQQTLGEVKSFQTAAR
jgi:murein DD-endopeptidase MepM/ murein hydrolase activator NlpD